MTRRRVKSAERHIYRPRFVDDVVYFPLVVTNPHEPQRWAVVDLEDFTRVSKYNWGIQRNGTLMHVRATNGALLGKHRHSLHAFVMEAELGEMFDHVNGDGLDNRKINLRPCTHAENAQNSKRPTFPGKTSRFKGVSWNEAAGKWQAGITAFGEHSSLGFFDDEVEAARAYDMAAIVRHGEFARTNATMKLYDQTTPFVPDCSRLASVTA